MGTYSVSTSFTFCYGHRLQNYNGPCKHLHGHNARVELIVDQDELDSQGMVCDFRTLKSTAKTWVDANFDHRMLLQENDPMVTLLREQGEPVYCMPVPPTAENIAREIYEQLRNAGIPITIVKIWENESSCATYRGQ